MWSDILAKQGTCADPAAVSTQQPVMGTNHGAQRPGPNAMHTESPDSGFLGGSMQTYTGPTA
ncbi:hypothetical protein ADL25_22290 [Streptomyces sp. NRRL F-5122]|uniref:hypothetical protein n=1 Tax=Streptomyces sp. NRRL F-5122 TaxID=1609098 RepID=UPI00074122F3|nr:hypothetical protein [Streptomyces sp. NRRL F-5122]KUJ38966.1 hypothetical protein ADL25_22290 [Streptomyces sp. NRRL F-5122]